MITLSLSECKPLTPAFVLLEKVNGDKSPFNSFLIKWSFYIYAAKIVNKY